jgi:plasmid stabilization system protein ParE
VPARFAVSFSQSAEQDLEEIWSFIAADNVDEATRFVLQLEQQIERLERFPERCPLIPENELLHTKYRHLIQGEYRTIFRVAGRNVYILRILHSARLLDASTIG